MKFAVTALSLMLVGSNAFAAQDEIKSQTVQKCSEFGIDLTMTRQKGLFKDGDAIYFDRVLAEMTVDGDAATALPLSVLNGYGTKRASLDLDGIRYDVYPSNMNDERPGEAPKVRVLVWKGGQVRTVEITCGARQ